MKCSIEFIPVEVRPYWMTPELISLIGDPGVDALLMLRL